VSLEVGQKLVVNIVDVAFGGEGVARFEDFVIFVPFVIPGEDVEIEITELKKRFARARLVSLLKPSPERVAPRCQYYGDCGGCQYQHIDYPAQLRIKHKQIADLFQRVGRFTNATIDPVIPCPEPYGYRNRIMIRSQWDKFKQGLNIGFIRADNRLVVDVEECHIAEPELSRAIQSVRAKPPPKGGLKVVLRLPAENWEVPRDSFFQNNFFLLPKLIEVVRERILESGVKHLLDLYCGVGFFGISLARDVESFVGIELDKMAIQAARKNAARQGALNGDFIEGRAEELLPGLIQKFEPSRSALLLDPPRTGCPREMLELIRATQPKQVLYVSCHPATLARDLNILAEGGVYEVKRVTPLDMFPQTQHVECVADVRLREPAPAV
jgi:tRNA/tmRNA/rRNA uracil-C5-methylase (TrmA/RlmC/RlmD family)